jgi:hypothetical protein
MTEILAVPCANADTPSAGGASGAAFARPWRPRAEGADLAEARQALVQALVRGEPAEALAAGCRIRLAPSYVVALLQPGIPAHRPAIDRDGILTGPDDHGTLVLLPALLPVQRVELHSFCERMLDGIGSGPQTRIAAAPAQTRSHLPSALDEARTVHHVTRALDFPPGVYQLADVPIEAALMRSPDLANLLAQRLAPLHGSGASLMRTLRVYLEQGQDRRQTSRTLNIHTNTLDYRLRRIHELTGLSPTVPRDMQVLGAAITAWRVTNEDVATDEPAGRGEHRGRP